VSKSALTAGNPLEPTTLQHGDEISASVNAEKLLDWAISIQASNRGRFNDHPKWEYTEVLTVETGWPDRIMAKDKIWSCLMRKHEWCVLLR